MQIRKQIDKKKDHQSRQSTAQNATTAINLIKERLRSLPKNEIPKADPTPLFSGENSFKKTFNFISECGNYLSYFTHTHFIKLNLSSSTKTSINPRKCTLKQNAFQGRIELSQPLPPQIYPIKFKKAYLDITETKVLIQKAGPGLRSLLVYNTSLNKVKETLVKLDEDRDTLCYSQGFSDFVFYLEFLGEDFFGFFLRKAKLFKRRSLIFAKIELNSFESIKAVPVFRLNLVYVVWSRSDFFGEDSNGKELIVQGFDVGTRKRVSLYEGIETTPLRSHFTGFEDFLLLGVGGHVVLRLGSGLVGICRARRLIKGLKRFVVDRWVFGAFLAPDKKFKKRIQKGDKKSGTEDTRALDIEVEDLDDRLISRYTAVVKIGRIRVLLCNDESMACKYLPQTTYREVSKVRKSSMIPTTPKRTNQKNIAETAENGNSWQNQLFVQIRNAHIGLISKIEAISLLGNTYFKREFYCAFSGPTLQKPAPITDLSINMNPSTPLLVSKSPNHGLTTLKFVDSEYGPFYFEKCDIDLNALVLKRKVVQIKQLSNLKENFLERKPVYLGRHRDHKCMMSLISLDSFYYEFDLEVQKLVRRPKFSPGYSPDMQIIDFKIHKKGETSNRSLERNGYQAASLSGKMPSKGLGGDSCLDTDEYSRELIYIENRQLMHFSEKEGTCRPICSTSWDIQGQEDEPEPEEGDQLQQAELAAGMNAFLAEEQALLNQIDLGELENDFMLNEDDDNNAVLGMGGGDEGAGWEQAYFLIKINSNRKDLEDISNVEAYLNIRAVQNEEELIEYRLIGLPIGGSENPIVVPPSLTGVQNFAVDFDGVNFQCNTYITGISLRSSQLRFMDVYSGGEVRIDISSFESISSVFANMDDFIRFGLNEMIWSDIQPCNNHQLPKSAKIQTQISKNQKSSHNNSTLDSVFRFVIRASDGLLLVKSTIIEIIDAQYYPDCPSHLQYLLLEDDRLIGFVDEEHYFDCCSQRILARDWRLEIEGIVKRGLGLSSGEDLRDWVEEVINLGPRWIRFIALDLDLKQVLGNFKDLELIRLYASWVMLPSQRRKKLV